jgi:hypothetical protein
MQITSDDEHRRGLEDAARAALAEHLHFRGRLAHFMFEVRDEALVVRGAVPSFYLKQVVQTVLGRIAGGLRVRNEIVVVSSHGLSSVNSRQHAEPTAGGPPTHDRMRKSRRVSD